MKEKIKILEFYPKIMDLENNNIYGTITADWICKDIQLRMLHIFQSKKGLYIRFPSHKTTSHIDGTTVNVPFLDFNDDMEKDEVLNTLKEQWPEFFQKWLQKPRNLIREFWEANQEKFAFKKKQTERNRPNRNGTKQRFQKPKSKPIKGFFSTKTQK
jgi:hypothetical protein